MGTSYLGRNNVKDETVTNGPLEADNEQSLDGKVAAVIQKIAVDAGDIVIEIADVAGNIEDVTARINKQTDSFNLVREAAAAMAQAKDEIANAAQTSLAVAEQANTDVTQSRDKVEVSLSNIQTLVDFVRNIEERLTGLHETARYDEYFYGVSDRGASVRIPWQVEKEGKGYQ